MASEVLGLDGIDGAEYRTERWPSKTAKLLLPFPLLATLAANAESLQQFVYRLLSRQLAA